MNTNNERLGVPSASGIHRIALCPGSWALEQSVPYVDETGEDAASGTRIHDAWAGKTVELSADEAETLDAIKSLEQEAIRTVFGEETPKQVSRDDIRLILKCGQNVVLTGRPDVVYASGNRCLILDAKTGRLETPEAAENLQLRALAVLANHNSMEHCDEIAVGIISPWQKRRLTLAIYSWNQLYRAREEILGILKKAEVHKDTRIPSEDACKYCRAKAVCPEARGVALAPPLNNIPVGTTPEAIAATLTSKTLSEFLDRAKIAEKVIEACNDEAKRRLKAGEQVPGYTLKPGKKITDIKPQMLQTVFDRARNLGVGVGEFLKCVKLIKGDLEDTVRFNTGTTGKGLKAQMESLLSGCTEVRESDQILTRE